MTSLATLARYHYEAPTATLEVTGQVMAISQWCDRPLFHPHRFHLRLHPHLTVSTGCDLAGDRPQFLALQAAIDTAVQAHLQGNPAHLSEDPLHLQRLTHHALPLPGLPTAQDGSPLMVSSLQLADLSCLFNQLFLQVDLLPDPLPAPAPALLQGHRRYPLKLWGSLAAGFVAAIALASLWPQMQSPTSFTATPELDDLASRRPPANLDFPPDSASAPESAPSPEVESDPSPSAASPESLPETAPSPSPRDSAPDQRQTAPEPSPREATPGQSRESVPAAPRSTAPPAPTNAPPSADSSQQLQGSPAPLARQPLNSLAALAETIAAQWQPPASLTLPLVYILTLNPDGTLAAITPRNDNPAIAPPAALPEIDTPLLPPGSPSPLELTLHPDGAVTLVPIATE